MSETKKVWKPTEEAKGKATQLRVFAALLWLGAVGAQIGAIYFIKKAINAGEFAVNAWVIGFIVLDLALAIFGSVLWKKSNRLNPPSEKNGFLFFMQSQLGVFVAVVAFLPLIIFVLTNKKIDGKSKAILGSIAGVAMVIAGVSSADFNPPSVEKYTEETNMVEALTNGNHVFWTKSGGKYHIYEDCHAISDSPTLTGGTVAEAHTAINNKDFNLCLFCKKRKMKEEGLDETSLTEKINEINEGVQNPEKLSEPVEETEEAVKDAA